jgi:hypothetical protein
LLAKVSMSNWTPPTRLMDPKRKPSTINRADAIALGLKRRKVKLSHAGCKAHAKRPSYKLYDEREVYLAKKYARDLSRFE